VTIHSKACATAPYAARSSRLYHCVAAGVTGCRQYTPTAACGSGPRSLRHQLYAVGKISACCLVVDECAEILYYGYGAVAMLRVHRTV